MSANADQADDDAWSAMYVYLLHFNKPINPNRPTQHYLGFTKDLDERIREHRKCCMRSFNPSCFDSENLFQSC
jgi:predicted GIY-YIG superfamily endonuclease